MLNRTFFNFVACFALSSLAPPALAATRPIEASDRPDDDAKKTRAKEHDSPDAKDPDARDAVRVMRPDDLRDAKKTAPTRGVVKVGAGASKELTQVKAAIEKVRIVPFMKALAGGQSVEGVSLATLKSAWQDKQTSKWIEDEFRAEQPNDHEWIPSNYMLNVILRAKSSPEGLKWIDLQDQMRSATSQVIFKSSMASGTRKSGGTTYLDLEGHTGALDNATGGPLDDGQEAFHNELRQAFDSGKTLAACVTGVKAVVAKWVWDGSPLPNGTVIDPTISYHGGGKVAADPSLDSRQAANFKAINDMLDKVVAAVDATK